MFGRLLRRVVAIRGFSTLLAQPATKLAVGSCLTLAYVAKTQETAVAASVPAEGLPGTKNERTFIAVKPDGVNRALVGTIIKRFEDRGFVLVAMKLLQPSEAQAAGHYSDLSTKPFFKGLTKFFSSGPIVAMVWEGKGVIKGGRSMLGATDPAASAPGSIRGDFCTVIGRNIVHGSDGPEAAKKEINFWFKPEEIVNWQPANDIWVNE